MASAWYNKGKRVILDGTVNLTSDTIKLLLVDSTHVTDIDDDFVDDVSGDELTGTGYTAGFGGSGRHTVSGKAFLTDLVNDRAEFTFNDETWLAISAGTAAFAIIIKEVTTDADSPVIGFIDFADVVTDGGDLTISPDSEGALQIT